MSNQAARKTFRPWVNNLVWSFYGLLCAWMSYHFFFESGRLDEFMVTFAMASAFTVWNWRNVVRRSYGQRVEAAAVRDLTHVLKPRLGASLRTSVALHEGGDADALVVINEKSFNIEIKAIESIRKVTNRHAVQATSAAKQLKSSPVIWLPKSKVNETGSRKDVLIVCGDAKNLVKQLESAR